MRVVTWMEDGNQIRFNNKKNIKIKNEIREMTDGCSDWFICQLNKKIKKKLGEHKHIVYVKVSWLSSLSSLI